jgi:hypothetical protein
MKSKRRLLILAALLLAFVNIWLASGYLTSLLPAKKSLSLDDSPPITRKEALAVYSSAVRVNLLINDRFDERRGEFASNPDGIDLTVAQREELESSIKKTVIIRPAGEDYAGETVAACFIPHHFFRYFGHLYLLQTHCFPARFNADMRQAWGVTGGRSIRSLASRQPNLLGLAARSAPW